MNYRHAYHAGNHADILKHVVLSRVLHRMLAKDKPFCFLDAHAGVGAYDLMSLEAGKTLEWQSGIGLMQQPFDDKSEELLGPFRSAVATLNQFGPLRRYPGSPALAASLVRLSERLVFNELHEEDKTELEQLFQADKRVRVLRKDATEAVKSILPFAERRGVVLLDPPFEAVDDTERMARTLAHGLRRMETAVFVLWYPVKGSSFAESFVAAISAVKPPSLLKAELRVKEAFDGGGLAGSGVLIVNPPYQLDTDLTVLLPALAHRLGVGKWGRGQLTWVTPRA